MQDKTTDHSKCAECYKTHLPEAHQSNSKSEDTPKKTPEGAFSETFGLNTTDYTAVRQVLLDLLTEYREMDFPANPELLKLHIDAAVDKLVIPEPPQDTSLDDILAKTIYDTGAKLTEIGWERWAENLEDAKNELEAWHKAEIAKLFEQIRSEAELYNVKSINGEIVKPNTGILAVPLEALTRLESEQ